jgi:hypothetical protein
VPFNDQLPDEKLWGVMLLGEANREAPAQAELRPTCAGASCVNCTSSRFYEVALSQALRARLRSACPSGTKAICPSKIRMKLAFMAGRSLQLATAQDNSALVEALRTEISLYEEGLPYRSGK